VTAFLSPAANRKNMINVINPGPVATGYLITAVTAEAREFDVPSGQYRLAMIPDLAGNTITLSQNLGAAQAL
jgi:hypothetical protein